MKVFIEKFYQMVSQELKAHNEEFFNCLLGQDYSTFYLLILLQLWEEEKVDYVHRYLNRFKDTDKEAKEIYEKVQSEITEESVLDPNSSETSDKF